MKWGRSNVIDGQAIREICGTLNGDAYIRAKIRNGRVISYKAIDPKRVKIKRPIDWLTILDYISTVVIIAAIAALIVLFSINLPEILDLITH